MMTLTDPTPWAVWTIIVPLAAAILTFLLAQRTPSWLSLTALSMLLLAIVGLTLHLIQHGVWRHTIGGWQAPLGIELLADGLSALMLLMTGVVGAAISIYARGYFSHWTLFWPLWFIMWAALNALFLAADIFNIYVTLELLGLSAVALVALEGSSAALTAAMRYLLVTLLGSLAYLSGVALLYSAYAVVDMQSLSQVITPTPLAWSALSLMTLGLMLKTALFPMHVWLPPAHANAPSPVSALLSALVIKASFYLILRLWFWVFPVDAMVIAKQFLGGLGAAAILWGSFQALRQPRLKLLVAYSTVAQVGYLFLLFPLATQVAGALAWSGGIYFVVSHACAKAVMFMAAGAVLHATGHDRLDQLQGVGLALPKTLFAFAIAGVSLMGLPPSGGFAAKWLLLNAAIDNHQWGIVCVIIVGGLLAAGYVFRFIKPALEASSASSPARHVSCQMEWATLLLAIVTLLLGLLSTFPLDLLQIGSPFTTGPTPETRL